jgi:hypothetical protein
MNSYIFFDFDQRYQWPITLAANNLATNKQLC